jgi:phytoene dehydrogenase-like protein
VLVREANETIGGGTRTAELTLPGFRHDVCSAIHPLGFASPFFRSLPLEVDWVHPPAPLAHPFEDGDAIVVRRSVEDTAAALGADGAAYRRLLEPFAHGWEHVSADILRPLVAVPRHPLALARFGIEALQPARRVVERRFANDRTRALVAGASAHSFLPLERLASASFGLTLLATAHAVGWPFPRGGSQAIADALASHLTSLGGEIETGARVDSLRELPRARVVLCDVVPRVLLRIADGLLPHRYRRRLERWRYGPGVVKVDYALDGPVPWRAEGVADAATVHLGASLEEIAASESAPFRGEVAERPFVLLAQQTLFDATRAPDGKHTVWAYCHVPNGWTQDVSDRIDAQIERFAPGFRERVLARAVMRPADLERHNANLVGGDIAAGVTDLRQLFTRPTWRAYSTPVRGLYICSAATPPGVGVHGMCGYLAAQRALAEVLRD